VARPLIDIEHHPQARRLHELVQAGGQPREPNWERGDAFQILCDPRIANDDPEGPTAVTAVIETDCQLFEWPQPLFQLIDRAEISCEVGGRYEFVVVLWVEIVREPGLADPFTQSLRREFRHCLRKIGTTHSSTRQICRKKGHRPYCARLSVLRLNSASDSA